MNNRGVLVIILILISVNSYGQLGSSKDQLINSSLLIKVIKKKQLEIYMLQINGQKQQKKVLKKLLQL